MFSKKIYLITVIFILLGITYSCSSKEDDELDTTGPVITLGAPSNGASFQKGKDIHIDFDLEDESGVKSYKIDIHWGEDHDHKSSVTPRAEGDDKEVEWSWQHVSSEPGGRNKVHVHIHSPKIPATAKVGKYHFGVLATDLLGNDSKEYIDIQITE